MNLYTRDRKWSFTTGPANAFEFIDEDDDREVLQVMKMVEGKPYAHREHSIFTADELAVRLGLEQPE